MWELRGVIRLLGKELPLVGNTKPTIQVNCEPNSKLGPLSRSWVRKVLIFLSVAMKKKGFP